MTKARTPTTTRGRKTTKQTALEAIERLPANVSMERIMYELYVRDKIERGLDDIEKGRVISHDELKRSSARWRRSSGR